MNHLPVDPEEMARRHDEDYNASLEMIGEGAPIFYLPIKESVEHVFQKEPELPETYQ